MYMCVCVCVHVYSLLINILGCVRGIQGEGMPQFRHPDIKGNLYVKFNVKFPEDNFADEKTLSVRDACMCVYIHVHMYVYVCVHVCVCIYVYYNDIHSISSFLSLLKIFFLLKLIV